MGDEEVTNDATVPANAVWYVRSGLNRSLSEACERMNLMLTGQENEDLPGFLQDSLYGAVSHELQWLRESLQYFAELPDELRPELSQFSAKFTTLWDRHTALYNTRKGTK